MWRWIKSAWGGTVIYLAYSAILLWSGWVFPAVVFAFIAGICFCSAVYRLDKEEQEAA